MLETLWFLVFCDIFELLTKTTIAHSFQFLCFGLRCLMTKRLVVGQRISLDNSLTFETLPSWLATPLSAFLFNFITSFSLISLSLSLRLPDPKNVFQVTFYEAQVTFFALYKAGDILSVGFQHLFLQRFHIFFALVGCLQCEWWKRAHQNIA